MAERPLISIVLPTHNGARYLRESIASCLEQTYQNLELVLVDDGSTEPALENILSEQTDPRVCIIRLRPNVGLPIALNAGFRKARGDLLTWTSDDNIYRPNALEVMERDLQRQQVDFVYARSGVMDEEGRLCGAIVPREPYQLKIDNCIGPCFLYRRKVMENVGDYDPALRLAEDYDYWIRVSLRFRMSLIDEDLYLYRTHGGTLTSTEGRTRVVEMIDRARSKHFKPWEIDTAEGLRAFHRNDRKEARHLLLRSLSRNPLQKVLLRPLVLSTLPEIIVKTIIRLKNIFR